MTAARETAEKLLLEISVEKNIRSPYPLEFDPGYAIPLIEAALVAARNDALEEAARVADDCGAWTSHVAAKHIRTLKDKT